VKLGPYDLDTIITGDARELAQAIPDESVDLIFTDPVYDRIDDYRWLAETAVRVLKPDGALLTFCGIGYQEDTQAALRTGGRPVTWILPIVYSAGNTPRFHQLGFAKWTMLLWAGGDPVSHFCDAQISTFESNGNGHQWTKNMRPIASYVQAFASPAAIVFDPFTGGGTVPAVCKMLGRHYLAFEIDPDVAERARQRVHDTQPPLFPPEAYTMAMELETAGGGIE
jgi:DNA modification methylase